MAQSKSKEDREKDSFVQDGDAPIPKYSSRLVAGWDGTNAKILKTNASGELVTSGGGGSSGQADKSSFVEGTTSFQPVGGVFNETISADPTGDQAAAARITAKRAVHVNLRDNSGSEVSPALESTLADIKTAVQLIDNSILGNETQVDIIAPIPNGTNTIGSVKITDGVETVNINASSQMTVIEANSGTITSSLGQQTKLDGSLNGDDSGVGILGNDGSNWYKLLTDALGKLQVVIASAIPAGTNAIGKLAANDGVDIGDTTINNASGGSAVNIQDGGNSITIDGAISAQPQTSGGLSVANFTSGDTYTALTNSAQAIKASAGQIYGWYMFNPNTVAIYVMVYNIASGSVTVGTSTAELVFTIPAGAAANIEMANGIAFATAMSCAAATTGGGNTAPTTALEVMFWYK